jgi:glucose/arabinose dehydrogenase
MILFDSYALFISNLELSQKIIVMKTCSLLTFLLFALAFSQAQNTISLQTFATGLNAPVDIANVGDSRLFVVEQDGIIKIIQPNGTVNPTAFLNIQSLTNASGERGLLGLAFHPNYTTNGFFYINYTNNSGNTVIARYQVSATNPDVANAASGVTLLTVNQPFGNHNGGCLKFGPDGFLYIGMGDGGSGGDPQGFAQNLTVPATNPSRVYLGKMLRLNVTTNNVAPYYTIPSTNPFIGQAGKEEIWALGLRNPWRFSFDSQTGELYIADVGQNAFEEINKSVTTQTDALNYGWRCYEGDTAFNTANCPNVASLEQPLVSISHNNGSCSITGGYVYRGTAIPALVGSYLFTDFCFASIGAVDQSGNLTYLANFSGNTFSTFGVDSSNEMYVASINSGTISKIVSTLIVPEVATLALNLTPNPAKNTISINEAEALDLKNIIISDMAGRIVMEPTLLNAQSIDISKLQSGMYILSAVDRNGNTRTSKFLKE